MMLRATTLAAVSEKTQASGKPAVATSPAATRTHPQSAHGLLTDHQMNSRTTTTSPRVVSPLDAQTATLPPPPFSSSTTVFVFRKTLRVKR